MKKILFILICVLPVVSFSQSFQWGYPTPISNETEAKVRHFYTGDKLIHLYEKYDVKIFNYHVNTNQFTKSDLEQVSALDLMEKQQQIGHKKITHIQSFQDNMGSDFSFFSYIFDIKTKVNQLYWHPMNIETGQKSDAKEITKIQGTSIFKAGNWKLNQSDNGLHYVVLKEYPYAKKTNEKLGIVVLDKDKNIVKEKTHTFSMRDRRNKVNTPYISNTGNVFIVKDIKLKKQKPYLNIYYWNPVTDTVKEYSLKMDDDYQIYQYNINFDSDNNMYFNGLLTHKGSKTFQMSVDLYGNASGIPGSGVITVKIDANGELVYKKRNNFSKKIISNLNLKSFELNNGNIWLLADKRYVSKVSKSGNMAQGNATYNYTYQNTGLFIGLIKADNGALKFANEFAYNNEPKTQNDNGAYLTYVHYFKDDNLNILYNDTQKLKTQINGRTRNYTKRVPIVRTIHPTGVTVSTKELKDAGIGNKINEQFDLDTSMLLKIDDSTYIIRAKSNAEYKYGYMKL
ncbi:MAG: hypothetical protein V3U80_01985 [Flavobacteriaceae bacterium]